MITIRAATQNDVSLLTQLGRITFTESFSEQNNPENFQIYLDEKYQHEVIMGEFKNPENQFFIAEYKSEPAGFIKLLFNEDENHPDLKDKKCLSLERIYVLKKCQGLHIGKLLMEKAIAIATANQFQLIWLGVWENNLKAIQIYKKWGFEQFGSHIFNLGGDLQTDLLMKKSVEY